MEQHLIQFEMGGMSHLLMLLWSVTLIERLLYVITELFTKPVIVNEGHNGIPAKGAIVFFYTRE